MRWMAFGLFIGCTGNPGISETTQALCPFECTDPCDTCCGSPVVIDVAGDGVHLTSVWDGVKFPLRRSVPTTYAWTAPGSDDAWLVMDLNGNGTIDDGSEMFGNFTMQPMPPAGELRNGFRALAVLDVNGDGVIDPNDPAFSQLRLWQDRNHDGFSQAEELLPLPAVGIVGLSTVYTRSSETDSYGNRFSSALLCMERQARPSG